MPPPPPVAACALPPQSLLTLACWLSPGCSVVVGPQAPSPPRRQMLARATMGSSFTCGWCNTAAEC